MTDKEFKIKLEQNRFTKFTIGNITSNIISHKYYSRGEIKRLKRRKQDDYP